MPEVTFHLLDIAPRDEEVISETEDAVEVAYDSASEDSDEEFKPIKKNFHAPSAKKSLVLTLFGSDKDGKHVRAEIRGFRPFFYLEIPVNLPKKSALRAIQTYMTAQLGQECMEVIELEIIYKKRLFGYTKMSEFPFIQVSVPSSALFNKTKRLFLDSKNDPIAFREVKGQKLGSPWTNPPVVYEANIDPLLRFLHLRNISPCNWVTIDTESENIDSIENTVEVTADWTSIGPTAIPPAPTAPFTVASWDIEVWSSTGEFPLAQRTWSNVVRTFYNASGGDASRFAELLADAVAGIMHKGTYKIAVHGKMDEKRTRAFRDRINKVVQLKLFAACFTGTTQHKSEEKENRISTIARILSKEFDVSFPIKGDPVIQIGTVLQRLGSNAAPEKHIFVLGSCSPVPDAVVHTYDDESQLILDWCAWTIEVGVDIFIGYNIFGFDERYMWNRMEELEITQEEAVQGLTRLEGSSMKLEEKRLSSSAMGDNFLYLWNTTGRLRIDIFHHIKRSAQLVSYKLDDTSRFYLSEDVIDVRIDNDKWVIAYKPKKQTPIVDSAVVLLTEDGGSLTEKMSIIEVDEIACTYTINEPLDVEPTEVAKWAIVKDDVSPAEMFKLHLGSADDRAIIAKYCVQDCMLVFDLFKKLEAFNYAMSMANVCSVPVSYIFLRGQGIKIESLIFKYCFEKGYAVQVIGAPKGPSMSYEGAIVLPPVPQFSTVPVGVADFASLYPSTMISENISFDTLVWVKDYNDKGKLINVEWVSSCYSGTGVDDYDELEGIEYNDIEFDLFVPDPADTRKDPEKIKVGTRVCRYAQDNTGMVPQIVSLLLAARKAKREELKKTPDLFKKALLDSEQNAYKITANSLYGQLGSPTFKLRLQYLAASVTSYGRKQIMFARDVIMRFYGPGAGDPRCNVSTSIHSSHSTPYKDGAEIVYGDSVTADTPIYVKVSGVPIVVTIGELEKLVVNRTWMPWHETKESIEMNPDNYEVWTESGWTKLHRVIKHRKDPLKKMYRIITRSGLVDCSEDHSLLLPDSSEVQPGEIRVGSELLHNNLYSEKYTNIVSSDIKKNSLFVFCLKNGKVEMTRKCIEIQNAGLYPYFEYEEISESIIIKVSETPIIKGTEIIYMKELEWACDYIYDLQTANHHFSVGPGSLVVHNTDSLFVGFNPKNPLTGQPLEGREALETTIKLTEEAGQLVTKALKAPHDFEFDKVYWPFLIFSKKRYVGHKYEELDHYTQASMGIALKRRDYAPIVKKVYGGAVEILLKEKNVPKAVEFVQRSCVELMNGKYGLNSLVISKSLKAEYANPQAQPHKVLADRMALRDPGNAPTIGDRIPFIYIQPAAGQQVADLQGERVEHPTYIKEKDLKPDYMFYITNQISNPVIQMFGIMLEQMPGYTGPPAAGWSEIPEKAQVQKEQAAYQILFKQAINVYKNTQTRKFMSLFGQGVVPPTSTPIAREPRVIEVRPIQKARQTLLDQFFIDTVKSDSKKKIRTALDKSIKKCADKKDKDAEKAEGKEKEKGTKT